MDALKVLRLEKPPKKLAQVKPSPIELIPELAKENEESLAEFLEIIEKLKRGKLGKEDKDASTEIGQAISLGKTMKLQQMSKEEIMNVKTKKKGFNNIYYDNAESDIVLDKNNTDFIFDRIKRQKRNAKEKKQKNIDEGIAEDLYEDIDVILNKYQHYDDDENLFKVNIGESFILNNKRGFLNDIKSKMDGLYALVDEDSCDAKQNGDQNYEPLIHQMIVKQYLNSFSPYRGLLLFHGLGSGKTCSSIGIIESMKYNKEHIFIMTPASLQKNYKTQMRFCGNQIYKEQNFWEFVELPRDHTRNAFIRRLQDITRLPSNFIISQNGVYMVVKSRQGETNYMDFSVSERKKIDAQINLMIDYKFRYINYNGITSQIWNSKYKKNKGENPFDNSTIIIDEGHNFVSRIVNKLNTKKTSVSTEMYEEIMKADNCNVVILSGTPLINYPSELGVMFNLLSGYTQTLEVRMSHSKPSKMTGNEIIKCISSILNIDIVEYKGATNILKITRNPFGFIKDPKSGKVHYDLDSGRKSMKEFKKDILDVLKKNGYRNFDVKLVYYNKFPDNETNFNALFVGNKNNFIHKSYFQTKIVGMVSYLGDKKSLMPSMVVPEEQTYATTKEIYKHKEQIYIEKVEMNDYLLKMYASMRKTERAIDLRQRKQAAKRDKETYSSSYRVFSRAACNFVFPESIKRPSLNDVAQVSEDDFDVLEEEEMLTHNDGLYDASDVENKKKKMNRNMIQYRNNILQVLEEFEQTPYLYFESALEKYVEPKEKWQPEISRQNQNNLMKYSPKYHRILENLMNNDNVGLHLLYSNFRTLEGIGLFTKVLDYYGFTQFKLKKNAMKDYELDLSHPYYSENEFTGSRKFYALYTGKESAEEKEIIRNIYNNNFEKVYPVSLQKQLLRAFGDSPDRNKYGDIIKLLIISSSGAEGIDLKNTRFVHIMEPYWHPVRINQVIGRARRICSHSDLPQDLQDVKVFMYLLSGYEKDIMREKRDDYIELYENDCDSQGNLISTDEKLYEIMLTKKKLMEEFLNALKEVSIDCLVNYEDKSKCLSFPYNVNDSRPLYKINYKDNAYDTLRL